LAIYDRMTLFGEAKVMQTYLLEQRCCVLFQAGINLWVGQQPFVNLDATPAPFEPAMTTGGGQAVAWTGIYHGAYAGYNSGAGYDPDMPSTAAGILLGYSYARGSFAVGLEGRLGGFFPDLPENLQPPYDFQVDLDASVGAHMGFLATERLALYAVAGLGRAFCCYSAYWSAGGRLEILARSGSSMFAEVTAFNPTSGAVGPPGLMARFGVTSRR